MNTAACNTDKVRVNTITRNNKVEYPGKVGKNIEFLAPSCPIDPDFTVLEYIDKTLFCSKSNACPAPDPQPIVDCMIYTGQGADTESNNVLSGFGNQTVLSGGDAISSC